LRTRFQQRTEATCPKCVREYVPVSMVCQYASLWQVARPIAIIRELREEPENGYEPEGWQSSLSGIPRIFGERFGRKGCRAGKPAPENLVFRIVFN